jgi:1,4-dihydroxy-2-naphthoate octaprenyltransferase
MFKRIIEFFVYSNLFIAGCAVLMSYQSSWLMIHRDPNLNLVAFVLFSTLCSYSFHWYLTTESVIPSQRIQRLKGFRITQIALFFIGLIGAVYFFFKLLHWWPWLLVAAIATFFYSAPKIPHPLFRVLRKVAIGKTIFLAFVWMYVTSVLPVMVSEVEWRNEFLLYSISRFFLIYAICILFDYRDRQDDKAAGVKSLITYLSEKSVTALFYVSILIFIVATIYLRTYGHSWITIAILIVPGILTASLGKYARRHFHDLFYYLILDGLMALSALLMLLFNYFRNS